MKYKVTLKTEEQLREEFNFEEEDDYLIYVSYTSYDDTTTWIINQEMRKVLGKTIEVKELSEEGGFEDNENDYTHIGNVGINEWLFHELWFKKEDFLKEDDFVL